MTENNRKENSWYNFRVRLCESSIFVAIIAYIITGYYTHIWDWTMLIFLIVPLSPILTVIEKINIWFELLITVIYVTIGLVTHLWHPYWVLFLLIPIYHILFQNFSWSHFNIGEKEKSKKKEYSYKESNYRQNKMNNDGTYHFNFFKKNKRDYMDAEVNED